MWHKTPVHILYIFERRLVQLHALFRTLALRHVDRDFSKSLISYGVCGAARGFRTPDLTLTKGFVGSEKYNGYYIFTGEVYEAVQLLYINPELAK